MTVEVLRGRIRLRGLRHVAPFEDGLPHGRGYRELGTPCKEPCSVFGGGGLVVHGDVQHGGELIVHVITLYGFQAHLLGHHLAVLVREDIILLGTHGADDVARGVENTLDEGILTGCDLGPVGKGVTLQVGVEIEQIIPAMGDAVDNDNFGPCLFTNTNGLDVGLGRVVGQGENLIIAQMSIEIGRTVLGINDGNTGPVGGHAVSNEERGVGFARSRSSRQCQPHFGCTAHGWT